MNNQREQTIYRSTLWVVILLLLSKVLGFLRQAVIAGVLGANTGTDIYFIPSEFTISITGAITQALITALLTVYVVTETQEGRDAANRMASRAMTICHLAAGVLTLGIFLFAGPISRLLAPGYSGQQLQQLIFYVRAFSLVVVITTAQAGYIAVLNAKNSFLPGKIYGVIFNPLAILAILLVGRTMGIGILVPMTYVAEVLQLLVLIFCARKFYRYRPGRPGMDEGTRQVILLMLPVVASNVIMQLGVIGGKAICSLLGESIASSYSYAYSLEQMVTGTFTAALSATAFPRLAQLAAQGEKRQLSDLLRNVLTVAAGLLILVTILMVFSAGDIVSIVYMHGAFTAENARSTALALCGFALGFPVVMGREMLRQVHFAAQAPRITMVTDVIAVAVCIALAAGLSRVLGVFGVAVAVSLGALCSVIMLCWSAKRYLELPAFGPGWGETAKYVAALAAAALACGLSRQVLPEIALVRFFVSCVLGCAACGILLVILRPAAVVAVLEPVLERLKRK